MTATRLHSYVSDDMIEFIANGNHMCIHSDDGEDLLDTIINASDYYVRRRDIREHPQIILDWINNNVSRWRHIDQED